MKLTKQQQTYELSCWASVERRLLITVTADSAVASPLGKWEIDVTIHISFADLTQPWERKKVVTNLTPLLALLNEVKVGLDLVIGAEDVWRTRKTEKDWEEFTESVLSFVLGVLHTR